MIWVDDKQVKVEHFPDGTQRISIPGVREIAPFAATILWKYDDESELSTLIYITRHLKNECQINSYLTMPYLPNARMDRIHESTECFTLRAFADVINWLGFVEVTVLDVHSDVSAALIDRIKIDSAQRFIEGALEEMNATPQDTVLYFPDAGAAKRYSGMVPGMKCCYGIKHRDWDTGKITGLHVETDGLDLTGKRILMIDDIIAYGGSMAYGASELKKMGVSDIYAYASHTENSVLDREHGTLIYLLENDVVTRLFTTDSLFRGNHEKITVFPYR